MIDLFVIIVIITNFLDMPVVSLFCIIIEYTFLVM